LLAVNPSETIKQNVPIRYNLPREVRKEDIIDPGGMNVDYDAKAGCFYVSKDVELEAKGTATFQIIIQDKWIPHR